jgi:hypothetical protein
VTTKDIGAELPWAKAIFDSNNKMKFKKLTNRLLRTHLR